MQTPQVQFVVDVLLKKRMFVLSFIILEVVIGGVSVLLPYINKLQIDQLEARAVPLLQNISTSFVWSFTIVAGVVFFVQIVRMMLQSMRSFASYTMRFGLGYESEMKLYEKLQTLDINFLENPRNRRMLFMLLRSKELSEEVLLYVGQNIHNVIAIGGVFPILAFIDIQFFLIIVFSALLSGYVAQLRVERETQYDLVRDKINARTWSLHVALQYELPALLAIGGEKTLIGEYKDIMRRGYTLGAKGTVILALYDMVRWVLTHSAEFFVIISMGYAVISGNESIANYTMVLMYVGILQTSITEILEAYPEWLKLRVAFDRLGFFLALKPRYSMEHVRPFDGHVFQQVRMEKVDFRYPVLEESEQNYVKKFLDNSKQMSKQMKSWYFDTEEMKNWEELLDDCKKDAPLILHNISCTLKKGTITALIGKNGSGKTTLSRLLLRNIDPECGEMFLGDRSFVTLDPKDIRKYVSIVQQTPYLLREFSIRENVLLGADGDISDNRIWEVLEQVGIASVIRKQDDLLDSIVGEDLRLSGGQEQLLVIARVLLQNRPILIFDEGTNQLDAEHELAVMQLLMEMKKDKIILMITHRMTSARKADHIYVLDHGTIIEEGTHHDLLAQKDGLYTRFWNIQVVE